MATLEVRDSRRLTGPNLQTDAPGAVLDVAIDGVAHDEIIARWQEQARRALRAVGWHEERLAARSFRGGASLVLTAPIDALYAATEVNEWAWAAAVEELGGEPAPPLDQAAERLRAVIAGERRPALLALRDEARRRDLTFLSDDDAVSVGTGRGSRTWPVDEVPPPHGVDWGEVHDVPVALVTGCNGKTTTVRLLAAMLGASGVVPGVSNTDGLYVGTECVDAGDWSGPGGARAILRDRRVDAAVLETARGGLLRRGLTVPRADAALVTNVAADHLGEFGVHDVLGIARVKLLVARAVTASGMLVVNADDPVLAPLARETLAATTAWFGLDDPGRGTAAFVRDGDFVYRGVTGDEETLGRVDAAPLTFGGVARFNVANVLGAIPVARALGVPATAAQQAIEQFDSGPDANPGRSHFFELNGARFFVDFAHNPHGMRAVAQMVGAMPARRRMVVLGQAGDRSEQDIRELVRMAAAMSPDRVVVKEMRRYLRGRSAGEIPAIIADELRRVGVPAAAVAHVDDELAALADALAWAREGDLVVMPVHAERAAVLDRLRQLGAIGQPSG